MREIKFRTWDIRSKNWIDPSYDRRIEYGTGDSRFVPGIINFPSYIEVSWFMGLIDKNGKEIYEGDILNCHQSGYEDKTIVEWDEEFCGFRPFCEYDSDCQEFFKVKKCEVIGNIYENPELLK